MRVLIDGRPLVGNRTGIGVHTAEIARRLSGKVTIASHAEIADRGGLDRCTFRVDRMPLGVAWQQLTLPRIDADVLWGPHGTLPLAWRKPSVVTLHDFTSITMPGRHRLKTILSFNLFIGRSLEQATRIACVSRAVADEAMRGFGVDAAKLELVPNGVDAFFSPGGEEEDYVLFTGTLEPRKGIEDLIAAWTSLPQPRPRLVLCGDAGWKTRIDDPAIERTGYVTRERLRELYRGARAFVYPSRYEGFGIPPLEAMACGAPVIATRTGAIAEFAEGAALLLEPGDVSALRAALARLLGDPSLRRELRARGPERAKAWTWDRGAAAMHELLRDACA
ncbi:MAG TPA: glycosyltransferase family 1 protein [Thermoanaerobaculia bacterium]|nr:glycosyltransferase family 1 protein [Thermoanaerobaculia bacterium]